MERIGQYRIVEELPRGNTGRVFLAEDADSRAHKDGLCVVKLLDTRFCDDARFSRVLTMETLGAKRFTHPYAARTLDVGHDRGRVYIVREYIDGMSLGALMDRMALREAVLPWAQAAMLGAQLAHLLSRAHGEPWGPTDGQLGLLHGHLSCAKTFITYAGYPKVIDLGLGRSRMCLPVGHGALAFRAPELLDGRKMTPHTDVYGLGITLHAALLGRRVFQTPSVSEARQSILHRNPGSLRRHRAEIPEALDELILQMVAKDPEERPADLVDVDVRFRSLLDGPDVNYAEGLADTMAIYFPEVARAVKDRRVRAMMRRRMTADPHARGWPARPSRPAEASELARGRASPDARRRGRPPLAVQDVSSNPKVIQGPWAEAVNPSLEGLDSECSFDLDSVVEAIVALGAGQESPRVGERSRGQIEAPFEATIEMEEASPFTHEVTPPRVDGTADLLTQADVGLEAGTIVGDRYKLIEVIGQGGASMVYRAEHTLLLHDVAVKILRPELQADEDATERFLQEARSVCRLDHPNIVRVTDFGRTNNGSLYLVMDLAPGQCLVDLLNMQRTLTPSMALEVAVQVLEGLFYAHGQNLVHRDLKPDNIMVDLSQGQVRAKILDFGIAKLVHRAAEEGRMTEPGRVFGTPRYMSPEQAAAQPVDARTDLYGVGITLYEMLSGRTPFTGDNPFTVLNQVLTQDPPPLVLEASPVVRTERVAAVVSRAIEKDPGRRFTNAREMTAALWSCFMLGGQPQVQPRP